MDALTHWWRRLGGLLAAAVVALLVVGPGIDTIICAGEDVVAVGAPDHGPQLNAAADDHPSPTVPGAVDHSGACPHGHCHHIAADRAAYAVAELDAPAALARLPIPQARGPDSDLFYDLERPPRA